MNISHLIYKISEDFVTHFKPKTAEQYLLEATSSSPVDSTVAFFLSKRPAAQRANKVNVTKRIISNDLDFRIKKTMTVIDSESL
jgi:hypothetical protein